MSTAPALDREEYIEQVYFFRTFRERLAQNLAAQDLLEHLHEEILATTRLPLAIQFLATELKHTGVLAAGFARLSHYFTPFQAYVIGQAEKEGQRFPVATALLVLEREAQYRSATPTPFFPASSTRTFLGRPSTARWRAGSRRGRRSDRSGAPAPPSFCSS